MLNEIPKELQPIVADLKEVIAIESTAGTSTPGKPYGEGPYRALEWAMEKGKAYGMKAKNLEGYCGYLEIGEGKEMIGILGHLDVVPAGEGWNSNPYELTIKDDRICGRGVLDDKGPVVMMIHILKDFLESGRKLDKRIRLILGTNEENVWDDIEYYKAQDEIPSIGFAPDGDFPVIFAEKGILDISLEAGLLTSDGKVKVTELSGGISRNSVADFAYIVLEGEEAALELIEHAAKEFADGKEFKLTTEKSLKEAGKEASLRLTAFGRSVHCQQPENGINAISGLMQTVCEAMKKSKMQVPEFIEKYDTLIGNTYNGEKIGCAAEDEVSGKLVFNVGKLKKEGSNAIAEISIRYPVTADYKKIKDILTAETEKNQVILHEDDHVAPIYFEKDSKFMKIFTDCYSECTGDFESQPVMVGGGSYARTLPNCVAFGPAMPGAEEVAHQPNEYVKISDMSKWMEIYQNTLEKLLTMNLQKAGE